MIDHAAKRADLHRLADTLNDAQSMAPLLELLLADTGFTRANLRKREFEYPGLFLRNAASSRACVVDSGLAMEERDPLGRIACVLPGNAPLYSLGKVLGPAYMMGNELVFRLPSRLARSGAFIRDLVTAHLRGVEFADAAALSGRDFLAASANDPKVEAIVIFGEDGWIGPVRARAKQTGKKLIFEGPGNDPAVVFEGAELEQAAREIARGSLNNGGQSCSATKRIYVHDAVYAPFIAALIEQVSRVRCGSPEDEDVTVGPIWSDRVKQRIVAHAHDAATHDAKYLYGPGIIDHDSVYRPCVVEASSKLKMVQEETFYPVLPVVRFSDAEQLTALLDDSPYGLNACVFGDCPPEILRQLCMGHKDVRVSAHPIAPQFVDRIMTIGGFKNSALVDEWVYEDHRSDRTRSLTTRDSAVGAPLFDGGRWDVGLRHVSKQGRFLLERELSVQSPRAQRS